MSQLEYRVEVKEHEDGFAFIELPLELLDELGWDVGELISIEETEVCNNDGESIGLVLSRTSH